MFHGSMVAIVTPMTTGGRVDFDALTKLIEWQISEGTNAIIAVGTTGESATLSKEEHAQVIAHTVKVVHGRIPVIAGSGAVSTEMTIELTNAAKNAGADACLLMSPPYIKPTQEGLYLHYKQVAEAVAIPQILYNVPGRTASDILPETVARLAPIPNIIGIKEATGDLSRVETLLNLCGDRLDLYTGDDITAKDFMLAGGRGVISVTANVAPKAMSALAKAATSGDIGLANEVDHLLQPLHKAMFLEANPIPVKWALYHMGLIPAGIRLPLTPLSEKFHVTIIQALEQAKITQ